MVKNKKLILAGGIVTGVLGLVTLIVPVAAANSSSAQSNSFVHDLASKLGIKDSTVQTAVTSVQSDLKASRDAQYKASLATAVSGGKITSRQSDLLIATLDVQLSKPSNKLNPDDFKNLTDAQRQAQMEQFKTQAQQKVVDALNAKNLNTTVTEVNLAQQAARAAGIIGERGFGHMGEMPMPMPGGM